MIRDYFEKFIIVMSALMLVLLGIALGHLRHQKGSTIEYVTKVDTLVIHDTISVIEPVYIKQRIVDSILVAATDTIIRNDTTFVTLPKQQRMYQSPQFYAWVSGYNPSLDSIRLFQSKEIITKEIPVIKKVKPKWGMGFSAGMVTTIKDGKVIAAPGIEFGIHRNILSW